MGTGETLGEGPRERQRKMRWKDVSGRREGERAGRKGNWRNTVGKRPSRSTATITFRSTMDATSTKMTKKMVTVKGGDVTVTDSSGAPPPPALGSSNRLRAMTDPQLSWVMTCGGNSQREQVGERKGGEGRVETARAHA
jgi:hypothetical protein